MTVQGTACPQILILHIGSYGKRELTPIFYFMKPLKVEGCLLQELTNFEFHIWNLTTWTKKQVRIFKPLFCLCFCISVCPSQLPCAWIHVLSTSFSWPLFQVSASPFLRIYFYLFFFFFCHPKLLTIYICSYNITKAGARGSVSLLYISEFLRPWKHHDPITD